MERPARVIVYIDGFNLYCGLKTKGWKRYYWLNLQKLAGNLLKPHQKLLCTKYFTSHISIPPDKQKRQSIFIEALETLENFYIYFGIYQDNAIKCNRCGNIIQKPNEKMTDVNIATEMLSDAFQDNFDEAILVSADSDLSAPIKKVKQLFPVKKIIVAFSPARFSYHLSKLAHAHFPIGRKKFAESLFLDEVVKQDGYVLKKPERWR
ncbi:MAG TPA: NYN domain-containing protein [Thermodesulfovibrionia bacterium]|nr:NYN domain-containing protein [Thermodesulfovibrionia bacterium]